MKTALAGVPELPDGVVTELYEITLPDGTVLRYTLLDADVSWGGHTYLSGIFNLERGAIKTSTGVEVDDVELTIYQHGADTIQSVPFPVFTLNGGFDKAWISIWRARQARVTHLFKGMVSDAGCDATKIKLTLSAPTVLLNVDMPRNLYAASCIYTVYDTGCGLSRTAQAVDAIVSPGADTRSIHCNLTQADNYFDIGKLQFNSGANAGVVRSVRDYQSGTVVLNYPLPVAPAAGDTFTIWPGCDKRRVSCQAFGNEPRYRGYPYMPKKEGSI
ncbi:MAG: DUF2163 domain-containing protein [Methylovulum sp.]|uniref:DUF2163 domain-containing protein n=1 Tax=Methylovulum sp. TaxID=1916980 RepID=UPI00263703A4|nr:DUF2163 domain-containing protein [Methylovulum sp.]MDD2725407.1 DUF2163 domain-containing protein [Methylovulum sp.]